jgi:3-oxoadipate enol-lactonase
MTDIMIEGETFNVLADGDEDKPVLILSNPIATNLHFWDPQLPALLDHFRVVRYDSRGHGATTANHGPYSIERLGRDTLAIMDALGIEKAHWLGLSMGSMVGLWLLIHASERIDRAVLAGTAAQIPGPDLWNSRIQLARETGMDGVAAAAAERWFTKHFRDTEPEKVERVMTMVRATPLHGYTAACAAIRDMDMREAIRGIKNKVLVIAGRHDPSTTPGMSAVVASSIEGAQLMTLEASHFSNIEDETNFTKAVVDFLTATETAVAKAPSRRTAPAKKTVARKAATRKAVARKAAKKASAKKAAAKKAPAKKRAAKKKPAKRVLVKKAPARKSAAKKHAAKKAATKRGASKKMAGRKKR